MGVVTSKNAPKGPQETTPPTAAERKPPPSERRGVVIFTRNHKIEGEIDLLLDSRLSDELNIHIREFLPVSNAHIYSLSGDSLLYSADFVTVNKHSIDLVLAQPIHKQY